MKPIIFSLHDSTGNPVNTGMLHLLNDITTISLSLPINGMSERCYTGTHLSDITNPGNFIAACIARIDTGSEYAEVWVPNSDPVAIHHNLAKNSTPETMTLFGLKMHGETRYFKDGEINLTDGHGNLIGIRLSDMDLPQVEVPKDFRYTRNPVLNDILATGPVPVDEPRSYNKQLLERLAQTRKKAKTDRWKISFRYGRTQLTITSDLLNESEHKHNQHFYGDPGAH